MSNYSVFSWSVCMSYPYCVLFLDAFYFSNFLLAVSGTHEVGNAAHAPCVASEL